MQKIPTLFVRDWDHNPRYVTAAVTPGCEWVLKGEGTPTRKYDGTCVRLTRDGLWWARREVKPGKPMPPDFVPVELDEETGKMVGWEPVEQSGFARWHTEAVANRSAHMPAGTYELIGPKINGNPEGGADHRLVLHSAAVSLLDAPRDFDGLRVWLHAHLYEGIVWHHPDGRMAKIKRRDFAPPA